MFFNVRRTVSRGTRKKARAILLLPFAISAALSEYAQAGALAGKADQLAGGNLLNGFKRYHSGCNHCHGPDGMGSAIAPSIVDRLPEIEAFRLIVNDGKRNGASVMMGFARDPNIAPYIDDIYAYLKARADGSIGRGRPAGPGQ